MYKHLVNLFGGRPVYLDTYDTGFGIDPARLEQLITPKTKLLLLLNSPGNPTERIFPKDQLQGIAKVCAKHGITVIWDEIYRLFSYWRLGYACGPAEIVQAMTKVQSTASSARRRWCSTPHWPARRSTTARTSPTTRPSAIS